MGVFKKEWMGKNANNDFVNGEGKRVEWKGGEWGKKKN